MSRYRRVATATAIDRRATWARSPASPRAPATTARSTERPRPGGGAGPRRTRTISTSAGTAEHVPEHALRRATRADGDAAEDHQDGGGGEPASAPDGPAARSVPTGRPRRRSRARGSTCAGGRRRRGRATRARNRAQRSPRTCAARSPARGTHSAVFSPPIAAVSPATDSSSATPTASGPTATTAPATAGSPVDAALLDAEGLAHRCRASLRRLRLEASGITRRRGLGHAGQSSSTSTFM